MSDGEKLLADEPRAFVNDIPIILLELGSYEEIIQTKVNTLEIALRFPDCSNLEVDRDT